MVSAIPVLPWPAALIATAIALHDGRPAQERRDHDIHDIVRADNFAPGNAGPFLFTDFLTPIVVLSLLAATRPRPMT